MADNEKDKINSLAKEYYYAKLNNNSVVKKNLLGELYICVVANTNSSLYKILYEKILNYTISDVDEKIHDYFMKYIEAYTEDYKDGFFNFIQACVENKLKDENKKNYSFVTKKDKNGNALVDDEGKKIKEKRKRDVTVIDENNNPVLSIYPDANPSLEEKVEDKEGVIAIETALLSMIINFYKHNKGKSANNVRYGYFKIFFTENLMFSILECNMQEFGNEKEYYENSDKELVRFVSFSDYKSLKDIISIKFKKISDVVDDYKDETERIYVPFKNEIIATYRFKTNLDKVKVTDSNISQQRDTFRKQFEKIIREGD